MQDKNSNKFLEQAAALLAEKSFSRESASRCSMLLALAEKMDGSDIQTAAEARFSNSLRGSKNILPEDRDLNSDPGMSEGGGSPVGTLGGYTVPTGFSNTLFSALQQYDELFNPENHFPVETTSGNPMRLASLIDVTQSAVKLDEGEQQTTQENIGAIGRLSFPTTPTWKSGFCVASIELVQDSNRPLEQVLATAFGIRFARGVGVSLVDALISDATLGTTATGNLTQTSPDPETQIGYQDLVNLTLSLDKSYRAAGAVWAMTDTTLTAIDNLVSTTGQPILVPQYDGNGNRILLNHRVVTSPSMDEATSGKKPICFYCPKFFVVRKVAGVKVQVFNDKFMLNGQVGFQSIMRIQGGLQTFGNSAPSPAVYLQMAGGA